MDMCLKVSAVCKHYGKKEVLRDIGFGISRGEIVGFLGRNGAGKSTCMKIITGSLFPDEGSVEVGGFNVWKHSAKARRSMGYLPENNPLYPEMYVCEYLRYVAGLYRLSDVHGTVDKWMECIGLTEVRGKTIATLSKGYRQRVGLAQALLHDPEVLVLDEPFTGMDPGQLSEMYGLMRELGQSKAILFSSHVLQEASSLCDRVLILHDGRLKADAPLDELTREVSLEVRFKELTQ